MEDTLRNISLNKGEGYLELVIRAIRCGKMLDVSSVFWREDNGEFLLYWELSGAKDTVINYNQEYCCFL